MINYAFYKIELFKPDQTQIVVKQDIGVEDAQLWFGRLFERKCTLDKTFMSDSKGNRTKLANTVLENRNNIIHHLENPQRANQRNCKNQRAGGIWSAQI